VGPDHLMFVSSQVCRFLLKVLCGEWPGAVLYCPVASSPLRLKDPCGVPYSHGFLFPNKPTFRCAPTPPQPRPVLYHTVPFPISCTPPLPAPTSFHRTRSPASGKHLTPPKPGSFIPAAADASVNVTRPRATVVVSFLIFSHNVSGKCCPTQKTLNPPFHTLTLPVPLPFPLL